MTSECDSTSETDRKDYWDSEVGTEMTESFTDPLKYSRPVNQTKRSITDNLEFQVNAMSIGQGARSNYNQYCDTESICTEDDTDSVVSVMAIGRGRLIANNIKHRYRCGLRGRRN